MDASYGEDYAKKGQYGDMFGALNAFISGLAFIGFLAALQLQRKDLKLQREELDRSRAESEKQTKQFMEQTILLKQQIEQQKIMHRKQSAMDLAAMLMKKVDNANSKGKECSFDDALEDLMVVYIDFKTHRKTSEKIANEAYFRFDKCFYVWDSIYSLYDFILFTIQYDEYIDDTGKLELTQYVGTLLSDSSTRALSYLYYLYRYNEKKGKTPEYIKNHIYHKTYQEFESDIFRSTASYLSDVVGYEGEGFLEKAEKISQGFIRMLKQVEFDLLFSTEECINSEPANSAKKPC